MCDHRAELGQGQHAQKGQAQDQGLRPAPGDHAAAGQVRQADLRRRLDREPPGDLVDGREEQGGVGPGQHRAEVGVGVAGLGHDVHAAERLEHAAPGGDLVAEPGADHRHEPAQDEQAGRAEEHSGLVGTLDPRSAASRQ